ncbi:hypothetical protein H7K28_06825 [Paenibacillus polymyxa]|nr:hypothetical protein [Paenibacillus polymyxa]MBY0059049.1 hypothetical protein [Paenibacillus polymyxa]MBY0069636.1 hypothetical protein [Paenibacillus polymyxa]MBY0078878.1 hypothetical protein [Paenibacillus polymyxa]NUH12129.1 hypothetical protein [Paenibacillus polymyxa]
MTERRHDTGWTHTDELLNDIFYVLGQIEIKDKALKEAETFVEELILAVDNCPPRLLDVEEIAQDGMVVINSIAASLKGEDTNE